MIFDRIKRLAPPGTRIPKPFTRRSHVSRFAKTRGRPALIYTIHNRRDPGNPHEKGITHRDFEAAHARLVNAGELTRQWFNSRLRRCAGEGSCNFTTVGGIFTLPVCTTASRDCNNLCAPLRSPAR